jgi:hypothetical protein
MGQMVKHGSFYIYMQNSCKACGQKMGGTLERRTCSARCRKAMSRRHSAGLPVEAPWLQPMNNVR